MVKEYSFLVKNWADLFTIFVSSSALVVSFLAYRKAGRALEIEEHREKDRINEQNAARLTAQLVQYERSRFRIVIQNSGKSSAKNLEVKLDGKPFQDHAIAVKGCDFPSLIGSKSTVSANVLLSTSSPSPPYYIVLHWDDDAKSGNIYETSLTF